MRRDGTYICHPCHHDRPRPPDLAGQSAATRRRVGMLLRSALDQLWCTSPDANPDDPEQLGCCPSCCAPCAAIGELLEDGQLDHWVRGWSDDLIATAWWDVAADRVDRAWLARAWSQVDRLGCCATLPTVNDSAAS